MKLLFVVTTPFAVNAFLRSHLLALAKTHDIVLCVNTKAYPLDKDIERAVQVQHLNIVRRIALIQDICAFFQLMHILKRMRPIAVHSMTPKAGLLAMLASLFAGVSLRFHTFTGQVWANKGGAARYLLKSIDRLIVLCATQVFADSASQCRFLANESVVGRDGVMVLGSGSVSGVDLERFRPDATVRAEVRLKYEVSADVIVFLFVGRLVQDKGVADLFDAFSSLAKFHPNCELWMVGPDEENQQMVYEKKTAHAGCRIRWYGPTMRPECFMAAADIFVLPSYREGFGTVVIEAAACGLPTIAYRIDGIIDAVEEGLTGLLVERYDRVALALVMQHLATNVNRRLELGNAALERVRAQFSNRAITEAWVRFYDSVLDCRGVQEGDGF